MFLDRDDTTAAVDACARSKSDATGLSVLIAPKVPRTIPPRGAVQEGGVPHRYGNGRSPRADRDPQRGDDLPAQVAEVTPGTVDAAVLPPIPVDGWTLENLPDHIAEVRQLYLDTLADWPDGHPGGLAEARQPNGVQAAVGIFHGVRRHTETVVAQQFAVFVAVQARVVQRLPLIAANPFAGRWAAGEHQRGTAAAWRGRGGNIER